jgi:hypothetical protein
VPLVAWLLLITQPEAPIQLVFPSWELLETFSTAPEAKRRKSFRLRDRESLRKHFEAVFCEAKNCKTALSEEQKKPFNAKPFQCIFVAKARNLLARYFRSQQSDKSSPLQPPRSNSKSFGEWKIYISVTLHRKHDEKRKCSSGAGK